MNNEKVDSFHSSLQRLGEILSEPESNTIRDAAIQRFEFTVELAWKVIQERLRDENIDCRSPKSCLQEAFLFGLVEDDPGWLQMMEDRNLTSHTYNEKSALSVYGRLPTYLPLLQHLSLRLGM